VSSNWRSSFAEADLADWVTVAAYLLAACFSAEAGGRAALWQEGRESIFWRVTAVLLVVLGINELLDLHTLLTTLGRAHAKTNGWYEERRSVQYAFLAGLGAVGVFAAVGLLWLSRRTHVAVRVALVGLISIGLFILLRAASFHHLDALLGSGAPAFNWGSVHEVLGILIVAAGAALYSSSRGRRAASASEGDGKPPLEGPW
jgi:hypothetical protein